MSAVVIRSDSKACANRRSSLSESFLKLLCDLIFSTRVLKISMYEC